MLNWSRIFLLFFFCKLLSLHFNIGVWCLFVFFFSDNYLEAVSFKFHFISFQLIYFGRNPGIMYEYTVPRDYGNDRSQARTAEATSRRSSTRDLSLSRPADAGRVPPSRNDNASGRFSTAYRPNRDDDRRLGTIAAAQVDQRSETARSPSTRRYRGRAVKTKLTLFCDSSARESKSKNKYWIERLPHYFHKKEYNDMGIFFIVSNSSHLPAKSCYLTFR